MNQKVGKKNQYKALPEETRKLKWGKLRKIVNSENYRKLYILTAFEIQTIFCI